MPPTAFERLIDTAPGLIEDMTALEEKIDARSENQASMWAAQNQADTLRHEGVQLSHEHYDMLRTLEAQVVDNSELRDISKIAAIGALKHVYSRYTRHTDTSLLQAQFSAEFKGIESSLKAARRLLAREQEPIVYLEIHGGGTYWSVDGLVVRPALSGQYAATSRGTGMTTDVNRLYSYAQTCLTFDVIDEEPDRPPNFGNTHVPHEGYSTLTVRDHDLAKLSATAGRANTIINRANIRPQTNALFIGEKACAVALARAEKLPSYRYLRQVN